MIDILAKGIGSLFYLTHNELYLQYQSLFAMILASIHVNYVTLINEYIVYCDMIHTANGFPKQIHWPHPFNMKKNLQNHHPILFGL